MIQLLSEEISSNRVPSPPVQEVSSGIEVVWVLLRSVIRLN
jgi:hypothetical protein